MTEGLISLLTQLPIAIAITALVFFLLGWSFRPKKKKAATANAELHLERSRTKVLEDKLKEAKHLAEAAENKIAKAQSEIQAQLRGMVPQSEVSKAQSQLAEEQRKSRELSAQIQRSEDGFKALRQAETKMFEVQNELSRCREEVARLKLSAITPSAQLPDSEAARIKESMKTAETLAGNERRRANDLEKEKTALQEQLEQTKEQLASLKPVVAETDLAVKAKLEADLAQAIEALQISEAALTVEKQRLAVMDREFKLTRAQLSIARMEAEKLKGSQNKAPATVEAPAAIEVAEPTSNMIGET